MRATLAPRDVPGWSLSASYRLLGFMLALVTAVPYVMVIVLLVQAPSLHEGHLPWLTLQWIFTTPVGATILWAVGALTIGLPTFLFYVKMVLGRQIAYAQDMTGVPPEDWPMRPVGLATQTRAERWLGRGWRAQVVSRTMVGAAALLLLLVVAACVVLARYAMALMPPCSSGSCAPSYLVGPAVSISGVMGTPIAFLCNARWVRHVEAQCGVWLRYSLGAWNRGFYYLRQPGVTAEAATAALARFSPADGAPLARWPFGFVLALTPYVLLVFGALLANAWLQVQWRP